MNEVTPFAGAVFYGRYAGSHRSPKLDTFEEAIGFNNLGNIDLPGIAAGTETQLYIWDSMDEKWIISPHALYEVGSKPEIDRKEVSPEQFHAIRSMGVEG